MNTEITKQSRIDAKDIVLNSNLYIVPFSQYIDLMKSNFNGEYGINISVDQDLSEIKTIEDAKSILESVNSTVYKVAETLVQDDTDDTELMENYWYYVVEPQDLFLVDDKVCFINSNGSYCKEHVTPTSFYELSSDILDQYIDTIALRLSRQSKVDKIVEDIESLISKAETLATKYNLEFSLYPAYGMGGNFSSGVWHPSSSSC